MPSQAALFLDRDGCLIQEVDYLRRLDQIRLQPGAAAALKQAQEAGWLLILITNQSGVARGMFSEDFVNQSHELLQKMLGQEGAKLDGIYYCPHHPQGEHPYRKSCNCRKPATGMIEQACQDFDIDLAKSYMIGDKVIDLELATNAGLQGILVRTGHGAKEEAKLQAQGSNAVIYDDLPQAIRSIVQP